MCGTKNFTIAFKTRSGEFLDTVVEAVNTPEEAVKALRESIPEVESVVWTEEKK